MVKERSDPNWASIGFAQDALVGVKHNSTLFPETREERCWFHNKASNVLAALPKSAHPGAVAAMKDIYMAEDIDEAQLAVKAFEIDYGAKYPKAVTKTTEDLDVLLEFHRYPAEHWIHLRTTNPIESTFSSVRLPDQSHQGAGLACGRNRHGLQADRVRPSPLAQGQRPRARRPGPRRIMWLPVDVRFGPHDDVPTIFDEQMTSGRRSDSTARSVTYGPSFSEHMGNSSGTGPPRVGGHPPARRAGRVARSVTLKSQGGGGAGRARLDPRGWQTPRSRYRGNS